MSLFLRPSYIICGMKADYRQTEDFHELLHISEAKRAATRVGVGGAIECSAKHNENIDEVIHLAIKTVVLDRSPKTPSCTLL